MPTTWLPSRPFAALIAALCVGAVLMAAPARAVAQDAPAHAGHGAMQGMTGQEPAAPMPAHEGHEAMPAMPAHQGPEGMAGQEGAAPGMEGMTHDHAAMAQQAEDSGIKVGVDEHLGQYVPRDVTFKDSGGRDVSLGEALSGPTMILPVYYTCPNVCHILQSAMARVLPEVALDPGTELNILSISFDENDTPEVAARNKRNFAAALRGGFPAEHWRFLTGDKAAIDRTMDALGFRFQRMDKDFAHPVVVVAVSPDGKIVRYLYGSDFLPFDVTMAATEAAKGTPGISVKRLLSFCYSYDPKGRRYAFDILRVSGITVLVSLGLILVVLLTAGKKKKRR